MLTRKFKIISIGGLIAVALVVIYWQPLSQTQQQPNTMIDADYYFKDVTIRQFADNGKLANQISSSKMTHYDESNRSVLSEPVIQFYDKDSEKSEEPWRISAQEGSMFHNEEQLVFEKNVAIEQPPSQQILTEKLEINLNTKNATSELPVEMKTNFGITSAKGLNVDFNSNNFLLNGPVITQGNFNEN